MQLPNKVVLVAAGVNIDKVVDAPVVVMPSRSLHASSTRASGIISPYSTCGAGLSGNLRHYFHEPLVLAVPAVHATVRGSFQTNFTAFYSNPEVDPQAPPGAVRTRKPGHCCLSCVRRVFRLF